ncbi:metallophosphoesterase family protein [Micromonospora chalcea]|uniref:metallophosphoesterase family protein n=1 Tax=Micromonospora chalcea TaxID=1874 RepID=UPI0033DE09A5
MADSVVLRFRDFETETVQNHLNMIHETGAVWWAWWKKDSEDSQVSSLAELAENCPVEIGLINRQDDKRFIAWCSRVAYSLDSRPMQSPEPHRTPMYYRGDSFPAWFQFTTIRAVAATEWNQRFGGVPLGESTYYSLSSIHPEKNPELLPRQFAVSPIQAPSSVILHLSDLHFGTDYGFPVNPQAVPVLKVALDEVIENGLVQLGRPQVGVVIVSGDITTRGEPDGFLEAQAFFERLLNRLNLTPDNLILVPGNHDILLDDSHVTRSYAAEQPFRNLLKLIHGSSVADLNRLHWFSAPGGDEILVLALNSVRPRAKNTMEYGYVGRDFYGPVVKELQEMRDGITESKGVRPLCLAVLHHHVLPTPLMEDPDTDRPVSLTLDAGQLIEDLQRAGVHAILHGHQHVPFVGSTSRACRSAGNSWDLAAPIYVIGAGSCSVKPARLWNQMRNNTIGLYTPRVGGLDLSTYQFAPGVEFTPYIELSLPLG